MKTLLGNMLLFKPSFNRIANSYAIMSLSYVVSVFLILFGFFGVAVSQSHRVSAQQIHSSSQNF